MIAHLIVSYIIGSIAGIVYGLSFVAQQKRVFSSSRQSSKINTLLFLLVRIVLLIVGGYYLLHSSSNQTILNILISFFISFWLTILKLKGP